ncbi:TetR/AcrR family transcriptional regulator C-terminal domain-containing protein [Actinosynnema sp. NPDC047251]|uniref:Transcriptional regulator, TetR family n=1 Tax=Saccharothrix espanaensis (strain ATCC 51144 / DSM 44229 / JCM 9112 / NBRC 15066 / NRRL 15764) TaxID=1179773 RepID=K0JPV5_SACES|nr:TetR/AcrR family transcriptional regulator C-terminal domain-containing protein [Saccharothrix espanaensis]CCH29200.1 Transcriptional regulator, TetR family [Saccharothrix espanaensis DSM 44229]
MPRTPILSASGIRTAALGIIDRHGLDGLSMRKLAAELGVQAASLYGHVATKDDLLHDLAGEILEKVDVTGFADGDWRHGLTMCARSYRAALAEHPNIVPFLAYGPAHREASLRRLDALHGGLVAAGWSRREATMIAASLMYLVFGAALSSFSSGFSEDQALYRDRYPNLDKAHLLPAVAEELDHDSFELALAAFVDGLALRLPR